MEEDGRMSDKELVPGFNARKAEMTARLAHITQEVEDVKIINRNLYDEIYALTKAEIIAAIKDELRRRGERV